MYIYNWLSTITALEISFTLQLAYCDANRTALVIPHAPMNVIITPDHFKLCMQLYILAM